MVASVRARASRALAALTGLVAAMAATGCATPSSPTAPAKPPAVYVAPFLDRTPGMHLGMPLMMSVATQVYERAPDRFLVFFDDSAVAVDGRVLEVLDEGAGPGKRDVIVRARAVVIDKRGRVRHDTGVVERRARYEITGSAEDRVRRRQRALAIAIATLGGALADDILSAS